MSFFINKPSTMSKADYDKDNNKKVDLAENAEKLDNKLPSYYVGAKWVENKTILKDQNKLTLNNICDTNDNLLIFDKKYGSKWENAMHWNRNNQVITFTSNMLEDLEFEIINLG